MRNSQDPLIEKFIADLKKEKNHPLSAYFDDMEKMLRNNPKMFYQAKDQATYLESILLVGNKLKEIVADRLNKPLLKSDEYLTVKLEKDWLINAEVEKAPPYHIYVSTNLYQFCAKMCELLTGGLGIVMPEKNSGNDLKYKPQFSHGEVCQNIKLLLESFYESQTIPELYYKFSPGNDKFREFTFYTVISTIISHEFAHVIINEDTVGSVKVYADFAEKALKENAQKLIYTPMHDPEDRAGFSKLSIDELKVVASNWIEEITADLIGVDLTRRYHAEFGPARGPSILPHVNMGIHLCFMAQMFLYVYLNLRDDNFSLISATHPPIDFRMHCVVSWIYPDIQHESVMKLINYCQAILNDVLSMSGLIKSV